jgi:hypothetical protein
MTKVVGTHEIGTRKAASAAGGAEVRHTTMTIADASPEVARIARATTTADS